MSTRLVKAGFFWTAATISALSPASAGTPPIKCRGVKGSIPLAICGSPEL